MGVPRQGATHTRDRNVEFSRDLAQREVFVSQAKDRVYVDFYPRAAYLLAQAASVRNTSPHAFHDQIALELSHGTKDAEQQLAGWSSCVDTFREADKVDAEGVELFQAVEQVFEGAAKTVELPDHHGIEETPSGGLHEGVELRPPALGAADSHVHKFEPLVKALGCIPPKLLRWQAAKWF
jgi:hypothetical protein